MSTINRTLTVFVCDPETFENLSPEITGDIRFLDYFTWDTQRRITFDPEAVGRRLLAMCSGITQLRLVLVDVGGLIGYDAITTLIRANYPKLDIQLVPFNTPSKLREVSSKLTWMRYLTRNRGPWKTRIRLYRQVRRYMGRHPGIRQGSLASHTVSCYVHIPFGWHIREGARYDWAQAGTHRGSVGVNWHIPSWGGGLREAFRRVSGAR